LQFVALSTRAAVPTETCNVHDSEVAFTAGAPRMGIVLHASQDCTVKFISLYKKPWTSMRAKTSIYQIELAFAVLFRGQRP